ncbi:MAG: hypothetical protein ACRD2I_21110, partial [Vicinamibacterales bacterium]
TPPVPAERIDRLARWLEAVARHAPGEIDADLEAIAGWSHQQLKDLWTDAAVLAQLSRKGHLDQFRFFVRDEGDKASREVRYSKAQVRRMGVLSCAADGGAFWDPRCTLISALDELDPELRQMAYLANAAHGRGDSNYFLRRGALLHGDVAMLAPDTMAAPFDSRPASGPQSVRMEISDGRELAIRESAVHWEIARMLLEYVAPQGEDRPAPERDAMVRAWYHATSAWMQFSEDHNEDHLAHGLKIFPDDPDLLFLAACQKETFAGAAIQTAVRSAALPAGIMIGVNSAEAELREAERLFQRTLQVKPDHAEARMHFGRVLGQLGKHAEATGELRRAIGALSDEQLLYYCQLFLGGEEEALGNREAARVAYEQAAVRFPLAQSPVLALSRLARRYDDRNGALRAIERLFAFREEARTERDDPWWHYYLSQARDADELLDAMRQPYLTDRLP